MCCVSQHGFDPVGAFFCIHLVLLLDEMVHKQTLNLHCPQIVHTMSDASEQIPIFQTGAERIAHFKDLKKKKDD